MTSNWSLGEGLKVVFPLLDGSDLVSCMLVSKQWRDIASDDYFWKCICNRKWPSLCKRRFSSELSYRDLFLTFSKRRSNLLLVPPRLSMDDLEFYIDLWAEESLIFSQAVSGTILEAGIENPPPGISCNLKTYLVDKMQGRSYKLIMSVEPKFTIPLEKKVMISVLVGRMDTKKMACILHQSFFDYIDGNASRALAYDYVKFSPIHHFVSGIRAWISLLFTKYGSEGTIYAFGIELDFCDAATTRDEVLWVLEMLDWK